MQIVKTGLRDVQILRPQRYSDARGWFAEMFSAPQFEAAGLPATFAQDNQSFSTHGVLRGLHYQLRRPQGKLVRVLQGHIWDVVVDLRQSSEDFGRWASFDLRPETEEGALEMLWVPPGFAHGFLVVSPTAEILYKVTEPYDPGGEHTLLWNDPALDIHWPLELLSNPPLVSPKDAQGKLLAAASLF